MTVYVTDWSADGAGVRLSMGSVIDDAPHGTWYDANPLDESWGLPAGDDDIFTWSGTTASTLFERDSMNWMEPGRRHLDEFCGRHAEWLEAAGRRVIFRPHCRHVLNDPHACFMFICHHRGAPYGVELAPALFFELSMLHHMRDHLHRIFGTLGPECREVLLTDLARPRDDEPPQPVPLGDGIFPRDLLRELLERHVPADTPMVLLDERVAEQLAWLNS